MKLIVQNLVKKKKQTWLFIKGRQDRICRENMAAGGRESGGKTVLPAS